MFGLGKLFSGLAGGLLDKIGLGFLTPFVSLAVNFFSGNYLAMIGDIANVVGQFTNSSFLQNLSQFQPLGLFGQGGGCFGSLPSFTDLDSLRNTAQTLGFDGAVRMFDAVEEYTGAFNVIQQSRETAYYGRLF